MWKKILLISCTLLLTGCGQIATQPIPVQTVSAVCGITPLMKIPGVVTTGSTIKIKKDGNRKVAEVKVKKGDLVKKGDVLFVYDAEQAKNNLDKAELEYENLKNTITSKQQELVQMELDRQKAGEREQAEYVLKINETDVDLREAEYNLNLKEKEILRLKDSTENLEVFSPFEGKVESIANTDDLMDDIYGSDDEDDDSDSGDDGNETFIKLVESDRYRIKGTIDDSNINTISVGTDLIIYSRMTGDTWLGTVSDVKYKNSKSKSEDLDDDSSSSSSKNPFYVELGDLTGLMLGQHVYMTLNEEQPIILPPEYISDPINPYVWISVNNLLAKQPVVISDSDDGSYIVEEGLEPDDLIALPSAKNEEGMPVVEVLESNDTGNSSGNTDDGDYISDNDDYEDDAEYDDTEYFDDGDLDFEAYDDEDVMDFDDEDFSSDFEDEYSDDEEYG